MRQRAAEELEKLGDLAVPALRQALQHKPTLEERRRIVDLIAQQDPCAPQWLRQLRAVEMLEALRTTEARALLKDLAGGAVEARLTREAAASLKRLAK